MKRWILGLMTAALVTAGGSVGLAAAPAGAAQIEPTLSAPVAAVASTPVQPLDRDWWGHHGRHDRDGDHHHHRGHHHRRGDDGRHGRCVGLIVLGCR
jgi:hypothetical protein